MLTINDIQVLAYGTYKLYLAPSSIQDSSLRVNENEEDDAEVRTFEIDQNTNEPGFIRIVLFSRIRNATTD